MWDNFAIIECPNCPKVSNMIANTDKFQYYYEQKKGESNNTYIKMIYNNEIETTESV